MSVWKDRTYCKSEICTNTNCGRYFGEWQLLVNKTWWSGDNKPVHFKDFDKGCKFYEKE